MSQRLISRSDDLKRLQDEGFNIEVKDGVLIVRDIPYRTSDGAVGRAILVCTLVLAGDQTGPPDDHTMRLASEHPHGLDGQPLTDLVNSHDPQTVAGIETIYYLSQKIHGGVQYPNYYDKVTTYVAMLEGPAHSVDPEATARTHPVIVDDDPESIFEYVDSASSRAEIGPITEKLKLSKVAIIGLGGTGSYVLDLVAKTPVTEIRLIDGDTFFQHNAFRAPGAPSRDTLAARPSKVQHFADLYRPMRRGIIAHAVFLGEDNVALLDNLDFAFVCIDGGPAKRLVIDTLEARTTPFIDVGMGIQKRGDTLGGVVRTTYSREDRRDPARAEIGFTDHDPGDDLYEANIQVADLNALNAALAVIRWKKHFGFYQDLDDEHTSLYTIDGNHLLNKGGTGED